MDKIYVNSMEFYAYHGVFPEENKLGQRFYVDVVLELDTRPAGLTDDLQKTVNYGQVYEVTKGIMEGSPVNLVETLTERIASDILLSFSIVQVVHVKVTKPNPPIPGHYDAVAVEIRRERIN
ncbi:dihydroneopterin aldolase [Evansella sp. AB-P1]|uniref:dihydroneopterin aldolase n=1 Tax=Evansella sp. AB-P1 TaxID=3037653 RepID=UPI00241EA1E0|nr:dihydroneopterin aldolase [Evansella sp. AB-P1]MDG5790178.1 dihydroneopterin aldolase [Evansella sp. AB-P1]